MADPATAGALLERARQYAGERAAQQLAADGDRASLDMDSSNFAAAKLDDTVAQLNQLGCTRGLDSDAVDAGYALALLGKLSSHDACRLLQSLVPQSTLSAKSALCIVSSAGETMCARPALFGQVDYDVQAVALWQLQTLLELDLVSADALRLLRRLYPIIEAGLNYSRLRDPTACILQVLSASGDCLAHRVDHLQRRLAGNDASIETWRLLEQYQAHDLVRVYPAPGEVMQGGPASLPDEVSKWRDSLDGLRRDATKSFDATSARRSMMAQKLHVESPSELAHTIETLALPAHASSSLLSLPPTAKTARVKAASDAERVQSWTCLLKAGFDNNYSHLHRLSYFANTELLHDLRSSSTAEDPDSRTADLLARVRDLSAYGGELLEELEPFLAEYLLSWDGHKHKQIVFDLIALLKPFDVGSLRKHYLDQLEKLATSRAMGAEWIADLVGCLTTLVSNLASRDDWSEDASRITAFGALDLDSYLDSLQAVIDSAGHIIETAVSSHPSSLVLRSAALDFHRVALDLPLELGLPVVSLPSPTLTHVCLLANDVSSLSEICGLIHRLRQALTGAGSVLNKEDDASARMIVLLNRTIIDFVNMLWQKRLLRSQEERGAFELPVDEAEALLAYAQAATGNAANSLGITTHPALAVLAKECLQDLAASSDRSAEGLEGAVNSAALKRLASTPDGFNISYTDFRPVLVEWS
ncbi:hypothetical protein C6P46_005259 [Rhodotorula mucilaginosa]|uniref:Uncharacterized protein n=1 Tax=Rhodotorula mucilaginosa TaxID=5537 RepID=A0A9P7B4Q2_RHOMI|nr:hypothetical protein C6P46_005259 [Rhodotorula mucilaginosa]